MWIEIHFSILEKTKVLEIYSFFKEGLIRYCLRGTEARELETCEETFTLLYYHSVLWALSIVQCLEILILKTTFPRDCLSPSYVQFLHFLNLMKQTKVKNSVLLNVMQLNQCSLSLKYTEVIVSMRHVSMYRLGDTKTYNGR